MERVAAAQQEGKLVDKSLDEIIDDSNLFDEPLPFSGAKAEKKEEGDSLQFKTPSPKRDGGRKMPFTVMAHLES